MPEVHVTMVLADAAQVADGRLYILGGGLSEVGPDPQPMAVAVLIRVPAERLGVSSAWRLELLDHAGGPVTADGRRLAVSGRFEPVAPPRHSAGAPVVVPLAVGVASLPVQAGSTYRWRLSVDGTSEPAWELPFTVRR